MLPYPRIALLIDTATSWGRRLIRGVAEYTQEHGPWLIHVEPRGRYERLSLPAGWKGDGVIARVTPSKLAKELCQAGIPAVNVSWSHFPQHPIPRCTASEIETAKMAAEYFLANGFRRFGYCGAMSGLTAKMD